MPLWRIILGEGAQWVTVGRGGVLRPLARRRRDFRVVWNAERRLYEPKLLERHIVKEIVERLWLQAKIPVDIINQPVAGKTPQNRAGIPDLVGCIPKGTKISPERPPLPYALPLFIEVKRPGGARRPAQIQYIDARKADGCVAFFAESWDDVVRELAVFGIALVA